MRTRIKERKRDQITKVYSSFAFVDAVDDNFSPTRCCTAEAEKERTREGSLSARDWRVCGTVLV